MGDRGEAGLDVQELARSMRRVNDCYAIFTDYARQDAGEQILGRFYARMPSLSRVETGIGFSRTEVWRRYLAAMAERHGDSEAAGMISNAPEELIRDVAREHFDDNQLVLR
jgi:hypothetical protein